MRARHRDRVLSIFCGHRKWRCEWRVWNGNWPNGEWEGSGQWEELVVRSGDSPLHTHSEEVGIVRKLAMGRGTEVDLEVGRGERGVDSRK